MYAQCCSRSFVHRFCRRLSRLSKTDSTETTWYSEDTAKSDTETRVPHTRELYYLFTTYPHLQNIKKYIPPKYFLRSNTVPAENIYLICPKTAKRIADIVFKYLRSTKTQVIAETNAGLGLIATELLDKGLDLIRLYETCPEFREELRDIAEVYPGHVELFTRSIYQLNRYASADKQDNGNRVETLLKRVPKRSWSDDPVMTIIGAMGNVNFLKYLVRSVSLQSGPALRGRIQLFAIIKAKDYAVLTATPENHVRSYTCWTVLFNLFFDYELLEEFPRKFFLPLDPHRKRNVSVSYDPDKVYFMRINLKQELPVPTDQLLPLYFFVRQFFVSGLSRVIPTIEKWVPDSGLSVLVPKMKHIDYYENMGIFTTFKELKAHQILHVFNEMVNNPAYQGSPFTDMVENELIKSETIETNMADANLGKTLHDDIEETLDKR